VFLNTENISAFVGFSWKTVQASHALYVYLYLFQAWHENDPYRQIEQDVAKLTEDMKLEDKQE
jgi:hypothetical protein